MKYETQNKTKHLSRLLNYFVPLGGIFLLSSCSFIELTPGASNVLFANNNSCKKIESYVATVKVTTLFFERRPQAIAEELQILAQNRAYKMHANAIWPSSEIENGQQHFEIYNCKQN